MKKLSIIIPCYNEEKRIDSTLTRCFDYFKGKKYNFELIVVDDGSIDDTREIVKNFKSVRLISYGSNQGKGHAVKVGVLNSSGDYILFCDADLSTPIEEIEKLRKYANKYDVVIASRALKNSDVETKFYRRLLGRVFAFFVNLFAVPGIKDTQCGFKLFSRNAALDIFKRQRIKGWAFDVEALFLGRKSGYKIKETPVRWKHFDHSGVNPSLQSFKMFCEILKIRFYYLFGGYNNF